MAVVKFIDPEYDDFDETEPNIETEPDLETEKDTQPCAAVRVKRGRKDFISLRVVSSFDKAKASDGNGIHILIAIAEALDHDLNELIINRTSLRARRSDNRAAKAAAIRNGFLSSVK